MVRHRTEWSQALEIIDELAAWGCTPRGRRCRLRGATARRQGPTVRGINYLLAVEFSAIADLAVVVPEHLAYSGRARAGAPVPGSEPVPEGSRLLSMGAGTPEQLTTTRCAAIAIAHREIETGLEAQPMLGKTTLSR